MMKPSVQVFRNFLVANLCALVPLWVVAFGWMPDQVKVYMRGTNAEPISLAADGATMIGEDYGPWADGRIWRFYLREGMEWKNLAFRLPGNSGPDAVARIELQKWKLLSLGKAGAGLDNTEPVTNQYRYSNLRFERIAFASKKIGMGLSVLECLLFALAWIFARRHREEHWRTLLPSVLGVSLALTLLMQVALPMQSYIANQSSFPFSLSALCRAVSGRFALMFAWNTLSIFLLSHCFGRWVLAPVFAFTVCAYLESGILAEGQPSLNGDWTFFADRIRARWDAAIWGGVFFLVFAAHHWLKKWYGVAGLCLVAMLVASILDIKPEQKADFSNLIVNDFTPIETVIRNVTYSTNRNVMVFVLDSLEREQAHAIMEDPEVGAELREKFQGFTEFTNNVGACDASLPAVPNLFTGQYPEYQWGKQADEFYQSVYASNSVLTTYLASGKTVFVRTPSLGYGYTNRKAVGDKVLSGVHPIWRHPSTDGGTWDLATVVRFRWLPFTCKLFFARLSSLGKVGTADSNREWNIYPQLADAEVLQDGSGTFLFMHSEGVHVPVLYNRHGELLAQEDSTDTGCIEMGIWVLFELSRLFDAYRSMGLYDNALIVVLADHGHHGYRGNFAKMDKTTLPGNARPCLWIKPVRCLHPFASSPLPTSHARVSELLRAANKHVLTEEEIENIIKSESRLYRAKSGAEWEDWHVRGDGSIEDVVLVPAHKIEIERMRYAVVGRWLPLSRNVSAEGDRVDVQLENLFPSDGDPHAQPVWYSGSATMALGIKVPHQGKSYHVRLRLNVRNTQATGTNLVGTNVKFHAGDTAIKIGEDGNHELEMLAVKPDQHGIVWIRGNREPGFNAKITLTHVRLDK